MIKEREYRGLGLFIQTEACAHSTICVLSPFFISVVWVKRCRKKKRKRNKKMMRAERRQARGKAGGTGPEV